MGDFTPVCFSTDNLDIKDRIPAWRDYWGKQVFGAEVEPVGESPFSADVIVRSTHDLHILSTDVSSLRLLRSAALTKDGKDYIGLVVSTCPVATAQRGKELMLAPGDATFMLTSEPSILESNASGQFHCVLVSRSALLPFIAGPEQSVLSRIPAGDPVLGLLLSYIRTLTVNEQTFHQDMRRLAASHIKDLFISVLARDHDRTPYEGGLKAALLIEIKNYIRFRFHDPGFSIDEVCKKFKLHPRYIQRLFSRDGITFSKFLHELRLSAIHASLSDIRQSYRSISEIALSSGFNDISHFNRAFKKRFGYSPGELRGYPQYTAGLRNQPSPAK